MTRSNARTADADRADLTPEELFAQIVDGAVKGRFRIEVAAEMVADAVVRMIYDRLTEIGLWSEFEDCADAIHRIVYGLMFHKVAAMKCACRAKRSRSHSIRPRCHKR
jgi:hypothetical protein